MKINLLKNYPKTARNTSQRANIKTIEHQTIARRFDKDFFDGSRDVGYGGFTYHPKWWTLVVKDIISFYSLSSTASILDVGCAKGFMLHDFRKQLPCATLRGIDISEYAVENSMWDVRQYISIGDAKDLSEFKNKEFDLVISINTIHNLILEDCKQSIREIERVGINKFITVDSWRTSEEEKSMKEWNLTALTMMSEEDWENLLKEVNYTGDYYWFMP